MTLVSGGQAVAPASLCRNDRHLCNLQHNKYLQNIDIKIVMLNYKNKSKKL